MVSRPSMRKQEVSELATLKEIEKNYDKIRIDDILSYRSHAEQKHISVSEVDSMERILKGEKTTQSMFIANTERPDDSEENKVYAYDLITEALAYKKNDVLDWLKDEYSDRQLMITIPFDEYVGCGFVLDKKKGLIKEYETKDITLCLEKDMYSKTGFGLVTAYPELRNKERIQETERDLSYVAKQTKTYEKATGLEKAYILYRTNPQSKIIVKY